MNDIWKLRAWDRDAKEMIYQGSNADRLNSVMDAQFLFDSMGTGCVVTYYGEVDKNIKRFELMQCTGLKCEDRTLIFDGDIVEAWDTHMGDDDKVWRRLRVLFHNGCFMFNGFNAHEFLNRFRGIKIIGNAHENPDMLDGVFARNASREINKSHEEYKVRAETKITERQIIDILVPEEHRGAVSRAINRQEAIDQCENHFREMRKAFKKSVEGTQ